jgi:hypothetical protein
MAAKKQNQQLSFLLLFSQSPSGNSYAAPNVEAFRVPMSLSRVQLERGRKILIEHLRNSGILAAKRTI